MTYIARVTREEKYQELAMLVFLDTEFTDFIDPYLISLGMAAEYGEDFYAEVPYPDHACSAFVRETVMPLLGKIPHSIFTSFNLRVEIIKWLEIVRRDKEDVFICVDYQTDWDLFCHALDYRIPSWCHCKTIDSEINGLLLHHFYSTTGLPEHHALYDAQANRYAYRPC
jgi:hypothetical protein